MRQVAAADNQVYIAHMTLDAGAVQYRLNLVADHQRAHSLPILSPAQSSDNEPAIQSEFRTL
jgi:hypothetical protein